MGWLIKISPAFFSLAYFKIKRMFYAFIPSPALK
ncbi:hypothetical protein PANA5342_2503 [Pantoea ananatis LMG 5342]|nr:hypothetical protein PANA5342_2503 [Pantoea ananatis LMG 5342]